MKEQSDVKGKARENRRIAATNPMVSRKRVEVGTKEKYNIQQLMIFYERKLLWR